MEASGKTIRCVIVTPEQAVFDEPAQFIAVPLYDGELGILPGRSPLIGRLGIGELRLKTVTGERRFYIDGGFIQIRDDVVTLLTGKAIAPEALNAQTADTDLQAASARRAITPAEATEKEKAVARARAQRRLASRKA